MSINGEPAMILGLGKNRVTTMGYATIPIPFTDLGIIIDVQFSIIQNQQATLLSLSDLKRNGLDINIQNETVNFKHKIQSLHYENDFLKHNLRPKDMPTVFYTEQELKRLHRKFGHPSF